MDGYGTNEKIASDSKSIEELKNIVIRGNSIYTFVDGQSWTNAEDNANKVGGHLVTINDVEEYNGHK